MRMLLKSRLFLLTVSMFSCALAVSASAQDDGKPAQSEVAPQAAQPAVPVAKNAQAESAQGSGASASTADPQQARIEADTKKLYQLALELRTEVGKTYKQSLSLAVLKKAGELEKLAGKLKSEMDREASAKNR
jgi:hypothetical protein